MVWILVGVGLVVGGVPLFPPLRRKRVMQEAEKIARSVTYADSSAGWPALYRRISARYVGGQVGYAVGLVALWGFAGADPEYGSIFVLALIGVSAGTVVGRWVGHLWGARLRAPGPPLVSLRERRSEDYLMPWELMFVRSCALVPLLMLTGLEGETSWVTPASIGVIAAASLINLGQAWWSIRDSNHQWARGHVVPEVA